ncbi:uncharacterized protein NEMAJ01_1244 [Nematocida major]|uniref:uncharacterized protein n=1 Tax=Nematocida major TaxID=1912982 RepID=UPI002007E968|nr:uncharacterized protein NEMAJ01_1244 [Nematocida major]KAH9386348.1 hypothetical protein NEMAJ01_1244 [Nematocida major]
MNRSADNTRNEEVRRIRRSNEVAWNTLSLSIKGFGTRHIPYLILLTTGFFLIALNIGSLYESPNREYVPEKYTHAFKICTLAGIIVNAVVYGCILLRMLCSRISNLSTMKEKVASVAIRATITLLCTAFYCLLALAFVENLSSRAAGVFMIVVYSISLITVIMGVVSFFSYAHKKITQPRLEIKPQKLVNDPTSNSKFLLYAFVAGGVVLGVAIVSIIPCWDIIYHIKKSFQGKEVKELFINRKYLVIKKHLEHIPCWWQNLRE